MLQLADLDTSSFRGFFFFFFFLLLDYISELDLSFHHPTEARQQECQTRSAVCFPANWKCMRIFNDHFLALKYFETWAMNGQNRA